MDFTRSFVRAKNPCADGFRWFIRHHQDTSDYQGVLDSLVDARRLEDAGWLLAQFGPTNTLLQADLLEADAVVFAGAIEARRGVVTGGELYAGKSIRSGGSIHAGAGASAGDEIRAEGSIRAAGMLRAGGDLKARWGFKAGGSVDVGGNVKIAGDVECAGDLSVAGSASITGDLLVQGNLKCGQSLRVSGLIVVTGTIRVGQGIECDSLECGSHIEAGWGIRSKDSIVAEGAVRAGECLLAGNELRAGDGYGIFAGLCVAQDAWESSARVSARTRPASLLSGWWAGSSEERAAPIGSAMSPAAGV